MSNLEYELSPVAKYRKGTEDDPFILITQQQKVINQRIQLSEIPSFKHKVLIDGYIEVQEKESDLSPLEYVVDYKEGIVQFHTDAEGKTINATFYGRGTHYVASSRVWVEQNNGEVTKTLKNLIDSGESALQGLEQLDGVLQETREAIVLANQTTENMNALNSEVVQAESVRADSENTRISNELQRVSSEASRVETENIRVAAEDIRETSETKRIEKENERVLAEESRVVAETSRDDNESERVANEVVRQSNETTRQEQETERQETSVAAITQMNDATNQAIANVNESLSHVVHKGEYDSATTYSINNSVSYNGSSYICIRETTGNLPTDIAYWNLLASKGENGEGTIASVTSSTEDVIITGTLKDVVVGINVGSGANQIVKRDPNGKIADVEESFASVQQDISNLQNDVGDLQGDVTTLQSDMTIAQGDIASLQTEMSDAKTSLNKISNDVYTDETGGLQLQKGTSFVNNDNGDKPIKVNRILGKTLVNLVPNETFLGMSIGVNPSSASATFNDTNRAIVLTANNASAGNVEHFADVVKKIRIPSGTLYGYYVGIVHIKAIKGRGFLRMYADNGASLAYSGSHVKEGQEGISYVSFSGNGTTKEFVIRLQLATTDSSALFTADGENVEFNQLRYYEITQAEYNELRAGTLTDAEIEARYPYVDGIGNVKNPYFQITGDNLLPPFTSAEWTKLASFNVHDDYFAITNNTDGSVAVLATYDMATEPNTTYTIGGIVENVGAYYDVNCFDASGIPTLDVGEIESTQLNPITFTTPPNTTKITFRCVTKGAGWQGFRSLWAIQGDDTSNTFKPRQKYLWAAECELAGHPLDRTSNMDALVTGDDGIPHVIEKWGKFTIDENFIKANTWRQGGHYNENPSFPNGYRHINFDLPPWMTVGHQADGITYVTDFNGKCIPRRTSFTNEGAGVFNLGNGLFSFSLDNLDTGWGLNYTPTEDEIRAFFMGWIMAEIDGNLYNGIGEKRWYSKWSKGAVWSPTTENAYNKFSCPTDPAPEGWWEYYKVQQLKPIGATQSIQKYENGAMLCKGKNMVEIGSGIILREKADVYVGTGAGGREANINNQYYSGTWLKYVTPRIIEVYKDGQLDENWVMYHRYTTNRGDLAQLMDGRGTYITYDPKAIYTVTYLMENSTLSAPISIETPISTGGVLSEVTQNVSDLQRRLSVVENKKEDKDKSIQWITATLINSWTNFGNGFEDAGYFKDSQGFVHIKGMIKGGTVGYVPAFVLPVGYRPTMKVTLPISTYSTAWVIGSVEIKPTGEVQVFAGGNVNTCLDGISFLTGN